MEMADGMTIEFANNSNNSTQPWKRTIILMMEEQNLA